MFKKVLIFAVIVLLAASSEVSANRRHFTFLYETSVLPKGAKELELWNTLRTDKNKFYRGLDYRAELEMGLGSGFQTSLYFNMSSTTEFANDAFFTGNEFSISNEWKYSISDPVADFIGSAIYGEWTLKPDETEIEGKILLDKKIGNLLIAANGIIEHEIGAVGDESENVFEAGLGLSYFIDDHFTIGLEVRHHTVSEEEEGVAEEDEESKSALFIGPTISYGDENWWASFSIMPQIGLGSNKAGTNSPLELVEHEKVEARLLFAIHL